MIILIQALEWIVLPKDDSSNLGLHVMDGTPVDPVDPVDPGRPRTNFAYFYRRSAQ